jgi:hypothetical protein
MGNRRTRDSNTPTATRPRWYLVILYAALIGLGLGILIFGCGAPERESQRAGRDDRPQGGRPAAESTALAKSPAATAVAQASANLIDDDGTTLWVSPTDGPPIDLAYLPPGTQFFVSFRGRDFFSRSDWPKNVNAAFDLYASARRALQTQFSLYRTHDYEIPNVLAGWQNDSHDGWLISRVLFLSYRLDDSGSKYWQEIYEEVHSGDKQYLIDGDYAYRMIPPAETGKLVIAPEQLMREIVELDGAAPPLRRDMERLLKYTDAKRQLTIMFSPNVLFADGESVFSGRLSALRQPLYWFLGDEFSAVAFSVHLDENLFIELIAIPSLDVSTEQASRALTERLGEVPKRVETYIATLKPHNYSQQVLERFPQMLRTMVAFTRTGFDREHVVLRCYLPAAAGHNLLLGAELTLAEASSQGRPVADFDKLSPGKATSPDTVGSEMKASVRERLKTVTSLRFGRETLEAAIDQLSKDVGVAIVILGADLQAEGITRNQQFGIDVANKRAEEILVEVLRLANPDKSATGPKDEKQKLVYVVLRGEDGAEQIVVTTRAAAAARGEELPKAFR